MPENMQVVVSKKRKAVAIWLLAGVVMIIIQVLLGGLTRLTESGLSITEWKPVTGALPPLNEAAWNAEFDKYKQIGQFQYLHSDFTLSDFKFIYFWEWFHRLWARLLGVVFAVGFIYFLVKQYFDKQMQVPFVILFLLGGLQGLIGWIMVASGLNDTSLYVNHIKLSLHFVAALVLLVYTLWFALRLLVPEGARIRSSRLQTITIIFITVLGIQLFYGAFMAGLKAAPYAPTWPDMNGSFAPDTLSSESWVNNPFNVQFIHRLLAYMLTAIAIWWFGVARKAAAATGGSLLSRSFSYPFALVLLQVMLGVFTVLLAPKMGTSRFGSYELLAELHQLVAMFLLIALVVNLYAVQGKESMGAAARTA